MPMNHVAPRDIDKYVADLALQLDTDEVEAWLKDGAETGPHPLFAGSTSEFIARARRVLSIAAVYTRDSPIPWYESAPDPIKLMVQALFDPDIRERLFDLVVAESEQYDIDGGCDSGQTYMQRLAGLSA